MTPKLMNPLGNAVFFSALVKAMAIGKWSFIVGSHAAFFTIAPVIVPLSGAFAGVFGSFAFFVLNLSVRMVLTSTPLLSLLAHHIPGLCSSLYWSLPSRLPSFFIALACIALFINHPVGSAAALYSLFWVIPMITIWCGSSLFANAVGSTFIAHAVGSVIWLYTVPMTADAWLMLIPTVCVERVLCIVGMLMAYPIFSWFFSVLHISWPMPLWRTVQMRD